MLENWDTDKSTFAWVLAGIARRLGKKRLKKVARDLHASRGDILCTVRSAKHIVEYHERHCPVEKPQPLASWLSLANDRDEFFGIVPIYIGEILGLTEDAFDRLLAERLTSDPDLVMVMYYTIIDYDDRRIFLEVSCVPAVTAKARLRALAAAEQNDKTEAPDGTSRPKQSNEDTGG